MKALYVLHESRFIYGANRSVSELLKNLDYDFDILICKSFTKKIDQAEIRNILGPHLKEIYICWLPRYRCHYYDTIGAISELSHYTNNFMALICSYRRKHIIKQGKYDYVHLNSPVLFPMLDDNVLYIMHVRDIINPGYHGIRKFIKKMKYAEGIIYIDETTKISVRNVYSENRSVLLNNPFNMMSLKDIKDVDYLRRYGLSSDNVIFSLLGQVTESKGAEFIIQSFMKHQNDKSRLLIVGNHSHPYGKKCMEMAQNDKRIIFCGELEDTRGIYRISDYVLRGESQFCIGRTIFEGLYAGCGVIIPGYMSDLQSFPEGRKFSEKVFFYSPRNEKDLTSIIEEQAQYKQINRKFYSNTKEYIERFNQYINEVIKDCEG